MINIRELATNPSLLNEETLPELKELLEKYPFFQLVRLLYVANLYKLHAQNFGTELRKASVFVPDRAALFALTESTNYQLPTQENSASIETEGDENRTLSLINDFLTGKTLETEDGQDAPRMVPSVADLTNDYASFLLQQEGWDGENTVDDTIPQLKGADLIDSFIEETKGKQRLEMPELDDDEFVSPELSDEEEEIYTESMVNIYIKQGRYQQALEILRKISLNNPKKSSNFAAQINLLEIILKENK
jgi:hypothetical protein